jgi:NAD(P)-dependent dehydrogenase (short-subunit alcohol dehydrogenase family)
MSQQNTAVLTGAAGTIGVATARRLIDGGAQRCYGIDIDAEGAPGRGERRAWRPASFPWKGDLGSEEGHRRLLRRAS